MSIRIYHTTEPESRKIAKALAKIGYDTTPRTCHDYASNIASKLGGADLAEQQEIYAIIARVADIDITERAV